MFTGIIEDIGTVEAVAERGGSAHLAVATAIPLQTLKIGDSIAVNGACLTVVAITGRLFKADVSAETLSKTNLRTLRRGDRVNLERACALGSPLGGHFVLGHVDTVGRIAERSERSGSLLFAIEIDEDTGRYIVAKGSVAVDGISLTVNRHERNRFHVNIIPHTSAQTNLSSKKPGDRVNIEADILGKYVERLLKPSGRMNEEFLAEHGFIGKDRTSL